jgi:hypothetical protein
MPPTAFRLPVWGQTTTFAQGVYIQLPDEGETDRGYWIVPDVLERMEARRLALGRELLSLGLLVNSSQVNAGPFNYLILTEYPQLRLESLIERFDEASPYTRLFAHDYVAVKRDNYGMNPVQEEVIEAILSEPPRLFAQVFELETSYSLPDGDNVYLYRQRYPLPADYPVEYITRLAGALGSRTRSGDAILLTPPELAGPFVASYDGPAEVYLAPEAESELAAIAAQHRRLFVVVGDAAAGQAEGLAEAWLNEYAFRTAHEWSDSLQLITYGTVAGEPATAPSVALSVSLGDAIQLVGYDIVDGPSSPGDIVPLSLFWQGLEPVAEDYYVFVHLLDENGGLLAQNDSAPAGGTRPTSLWEVGETITDRRGLLLPDGLPSGEYQLRAGIYLPTTGERLFVMDGEGNSLGDSLSLGLVLVRSP